MVRRGIACVCLAAVLAVGPSARAQSDEDPDSEETSEPLVGETPRERADPPGDADDESPAEEGDDTIRLDDDLDDVGADVTFDADDENTDGEPIARTNVARLDTKALAYGRMGVDMVHDETVTGADGIVEGREDTFYFRLHGRAEGTGRFGRRVKVKVAGRVDAEVSFDQETEFGIQRYEANIWDTYADVYGERFDLRFGNQLITWGYTDLLSPNDVINSRDLRRGPVVPVDELRIPVLAAKTTAYAGPFYLQGVWVPIAPTDRFELLDGDHAILGPNATSVVERRIGSILKSLEGDPNLGASLAPILAIGERPDNGIETGEVGASLGLRTPAIDAATYIYYGHERAPRIRVAQELADVLQMADPATLSPEAIGMELANLAMMGITPVEIDHPRKLSLGAAVSARVEPVGLKLEGAYQPEANTIVIPPGGGPLVGAAMALPQMTIAGGFDYARGTELNVLIEAAYTRIFDVPAGLEVFRFDQDRLYTIGSRVAWSTGRGTFQLRFLGFVDVTSPSYAIKPALRLSGHDHLSIEIAVGVYGGPANSLGGTQDRNDEVLLTVEYGL